MIGKILGNRYEIVEKVGGGGMAVVYRAKCKLLNRYVAVKILRSEFTNDRIIIDKFKGESQAAASLSHPNIVNIYDVGEEGEIYYIVMEYVKGRTLKQVIQDKGSLTLAEILNYTKQIAYAIQHAHYNSVIHRDIKPHNILITEDNRAKVTDFGIALAATSSTMTNMGSVIGSVHYFSPEQARGGYTDEKSDLYSLGIVMYEMATGKLPFEGDSPVSIALKHIQEEAIAPTEIKPDMSKALENIILRLIQKDQASRYQDAEMLIQDLEQLNNGVNPDYPLDILSHEDSPTQIIPRIEEKDIDNTSGRTRKTKNQNNRKIVVAAVVMALIGALLFTFGLFYFGNLDLFKTETIDTPNFVGKDIELVRQEAQTMGLKLDEEFRPSDEVAANEVMQQRPEEGMPVKRGHLINIWISTGPKPSVVPNLVFKDASNAPFILENAGLKAGNPSYEFDELPEGTIIRQDPRAGSTISTGSTVDYVVSQGPKLVTFPMPDFRGMELAQAKEEIAKLNLKEGEISREFSEEFAEDLIIRQSIKAGDMVEENTPVDFVLSKGQEREDDIEGPVIEEGHPENDYDPISKQRVQIEFKGHSGLINIIIKNASTGQEVVNMEHDVDKDGSTVFVTLSGRGKQEFELYINGVKQQNIFVNF